MTDKTDPGPLAVRETDHPGQYVIESDHANHPGGPWDMIYVCFSGYFGAYGPHRPRQGQGGRVMPIMSESPDLRWFEPLGTCRCGKPATGTLRGVRNDSYGAHCARCAEKRLRASEKRRAEIAKAKGEGA